MTRRFAAIGGALVSALAAVVLAGPQEQNPQQPIFRREVDVIRLDVSVLDEDRKPLRGLTADDFEVKEDGKVQRVVAVSEIDNSERDPRPAAWMRYTPRDVAANDIVDQVGDGRIVGMIIGGVNAFGPWSNDTLLNARAIGHYVVDGLGASDVAAVIYPRDPALTEDFTDDRLKLRAALDRFGVTTSLYVPPTPQGAGPRGGDMMQRFAPALMRSECQRTQPMVPAIDALVSRLAVIPNRRKTILIVASGLSVFPGGRCSELYQQLTDAYRKAQRANVNIYSIDPRDYNALAIGSGARNARGSEDALDMAAEYTGGRVLRGRLATDDNIDGMMAEGGSYYLVGYQSSNPNADGKFRKVEVHVKRPGAEVRTASGRYAARAGQLEPAERREATTSSELNLTGLYDPAGVPLRATALPIGLADPSRGADADVLVLVGVRWPAPRGPMTDALTLVRNLYDADGRVGALEREELPLAIRANAGDDFRFELVRSLRLAPGRYQIRYNVTSKLLNRSASIYADIEVPDFTRPGIAMTPVMLGVRSDEPAPSAATKLPVAPTTARDFAPTDHLDAFVRVFQGGTTPVGAVTIATQLFDTSDHRIVDTTTALAASDFDGRSAPFMVSVPLDQLRHGPHLLSISATMAGSPAIRRDVVFRVR